MKKRAVLLSNQACRGSKALLILIQDKERKADGAVFRKRAGRDAHAVIGKNPRLSIVDQTLGRIAVAPLVAVVQNAGHEVILGFEPGLELRNKFDTAGTPALMGHLTADTKQAVSQIINAIPG